MRKSIGIQIFCIIVLLIAFAGTSFGSEGLPLEVRSKLGISPYDVDRFETVYTYTPTKADKEERSVGEYNRMMTKIDYAYLGGNAHLWCIDYAGPSSADYNWNTAFYINADNNSDTGRTNAGGTEELITFICNAGSYRVLRTHYTADGTSHSNYEPTPIFAIYGNSLYLRYDEVPKNQEDGKLIFTYRIITEGWLQKDDRRGIINGTPWFPEAEYYWNPMMPEPQQVYVYPNPFNDTIRMPILLKVDSEVRLDIYDESGRRVYSDKGQILLAGYHEILWDGRELDGQESPSGLYRCLITIKSEDGTLQKIEGTAVKTG